MSTETLSPISHSVDTKPNPAVICTRIVTEADIPVLAAIGRTTFYDTFGAHKTTNKEEDITNHLETEYTHDVLLQELQTPGSVFYFACVNDEVAGFLKLNTAPAQTMLNDPSMLEIERIYVLEKFQKQKLGSLLMNLALSIAEAKKMDYIWLGVWEDNIPAINFYLRYGFEQFLEKKFVIGSDVQRDIMFRKKIENK